MNKSLRLCIIFTVFLANHTYANTPTEALKVAVHRLITIAADTDHDDIYKKAGLAEVISSEVDFNAVSKRVVSKPWRKATAEQKSLFKIKFTQITVNTYFTLLKNYSNEKVIFQKEQIKKNKYAIVDTQIISGNKKIPVRYRLIKVADSWKIYDFIPEGISFISTYKNNYSSVLKKEGMDGLLNAMTKAIDPQEQ